jgi:phage baseplate assembly protein V
MAGAEFKRGIVRENDGAKARSRVEIVDEDGAQSYWLAWNTSAGASNVYEAPDIGSQVNVLMDGQGEDGVILGSRYSDVDQPPTTDPRQTKIALEGGLTLTWDRASRTLAIAMPQGLNLQVGTLTITGNVAISGGTLTHNGKDVGATHKHSGVEPGGGQSGQPV